ncbi:MAG: sensor histidine kinase, partial [Flavobacteriaceae bacterium]|nr:sensor histidine kinase [Flavobacteriaceae bacterium]
MKKTYRFAAITALVLTSLLTLILSVFLALNSSFNLYLVFGFALLCYLLCFVVIQDRIERFIYRRIKQIYDDLTLLETSSFKNRPITTDMATLTEEIERYAQDKKLEIETLKIREEYRKE